MIFEWPRIAYFAVLVSPKVLHVTRYLLPGRAAFSMSFGMSMENTLSISYTRFLSNRLNLEISLISRSDRRNFSTLPPEDEVSKSTRNHGLAGIPRFMHRKHRANKTADAEATLTRCVKPPRPNSTPRSRLASD